MQLFSALILICSVATGEAKCEAVNLPVMHTEQRECLRQLNMYEQDNGHDLSLEEKYVMSGVCIDWRFQAMKIDKLLTSTEQLNIFTVTLAGRYYPKLTSAFPKK